MTQMILYKMEKENIKPDYNLLREQLVLVAKEYNACNGFLSSVHKIKDKASFDKFFRSNIDMIAEKFGFVSADQSEIDDLETQVEDLEDDISRLQDEVEEHKHRYGVIETLWDEEKARCFVENKDKYTSWDFEKLLENGNKYLKLTN